MYLTISFADGRMLEAVLLAVSRDRMRLAIQGRAETAEFRLVDGEWTSEEGEKIELESLVSDGSLDLAEFGGNLFPRTSAARN